MSAVRSASNRHVAEDGDRLGGDEAFFSGAPHSRHFVGVHSKLCKRTSGKYAQMETWSTRRRGAAAVTCTGGGSRRQAEAGNAV
ncbi:unnamed protein product [Merluccius merluccius]